VKRRDSDRLGANERRIEIEAKGKEEFLRSPPARDARGRLCGVRIHKEKEREPIGLKEFRSKSLFHSETRGHVLTPFFGTYQSVGQAANGEWAGA